MQEKTRGVLPDDLRNNACSCRHTLLDTRHLDTEPYHLRRILLRGSVITIASATTTATTATIATIATIAAMVIICPLSPEVCVDIVMSDLLNNNRGDVSKAMATKATTITRK